MNMIHSMLLLASLLITSCTSNNNEVLNNQEDFLKIGDKTYIISNHAASPDVTNGTNNWALTFLAEDDQSIETIITGVLLYNPNIDGANLHVTVNESGQLTQYVSVCDLDIPEDESLLLNPNLDLSITNSFVDQVFEVCLLNQAGLLEGPFNAELRINN